MLNNVSQELIIRFQELFPAFRCIFFAYAFFKPVQKKDAAAIRAGKLCCFIPPQL